MRVCNFLIFHLDTNVAVWFCKKSFYRIRLALFFFIFLSGSLFAPEFFRDDSTDDLQVFPRFRIGTIGGRVSKIPRSKFELNQSTWSVANPKITRVFPIFYAAHVYRKREKSNCLQRSATSKWKKKRDCANIDQSQKYRFWLYLTFFTIIISRRRFVDCSVMCVVINTFLFQFDVCDSRLSVNYRELWFIFLLSFFFGEKNMSQRGVIDIGASRSVHLVIDSFFDEPGMSERWKWRFEYVIFFRWLLSYYWRVHTCMYSRCNKVSMQIITYHRKNLIMYLLILISLWTIYFIHLYNHKYEAE